MPRDLPTLPFVVMINHGGMLRDMVPSSESQENQDAWKLFYGCCLNRIFPIFF